MRNLSLGFAGAMLISIPSPAISQTTYPIRPIRFIVPFSPGGNADTLARLTAQKLTDALGQQVIVDNRAGGGGIIGMEIVARATPDGHTIVLGYTSTIAITPSLMANPPYDGAKDFSPITQLASAPNIIVINPTVPAHTLKELVALSKAKPKSINFGSPGVGTVGHLTGEMLNTAFGTDFQHVAYKGNNLSVIDLVSGNIQMSIGGISPLISHIKSGRLRAIAVTSASRTSAFPQVPSVAESLMPGFEATAWYGVLSPAKTPSAAIMRLYVEINKILTSPDIKKRLESMDFDIVGSKPDEFAAFMATETLKWAKVVKASGISAK